MTIRELRILPPLAIARLGSASEPLDNYTILENEERPLDYRTIVPQETLVVDDPLSSHDSHRRRKTVAAIKELGGRCQQVIVLSHDEFLLRDITADVAADVAPRPPRGP